MRLPSEAHKAVLVHIIRRAEDMYVSLKNREDRRRDKRYMVVQGLLRKFDQETAAHCLDYTFTRPEVRLLQEQLSGVCKVLAESSIPTYQQRIEALAGKEGLTEEERLRHTKQYEEYIDKNKQRLKLCDDLVRLFNLAL